MKPGTAANQQDAARLRVLFAGHLPPPLGGIATYCQSVLASSLGKRLELSFVQTSTHDRDLSQAGSASFRNLSAAFQDVARFFKAVRTQRPQVCHLNTAYGSSFVKNSLCLVIARLHGSRALLHIHCSLPALYTGKPGWWRWFFRRVVSFSSGVIALSSEWLELAQIVPGRPVFLLENAIDLAPYQAIARERHEWQALDGPLHVLYLGYIWKAKGSFDLVEAARQVSENNQTEMLSFRVVFELVGSEMRPPELQQLAALIHESGLEGVVSLHPPVFGEEKLACFRRAGVFVYPSYSEGMPMAVIEAMASGLPVIASRAGGLPDLVQDAVTGLLVDPGKPEQLAAALDQLIHDPALRQSMGEQGARLAAERFDIEQHAARLVEVYYGCLSSDRNSV